MSDAIEKIKVKYGYLRSYYVGMGYSLQGNRKTKEGSSHPDRDQQFMHISEKRNCLLPLMEVAVMAVA